VDVEVYFGIEGSDVFYFAELVDFVLHVVCEGDGAEDGEGARLETHCGRAINIASSCELNCAYRLCRGLRSLSCQIARMALRVW
jgi:hypothetical protein